MIFTMLERVVKLRVNCVSYKSAEIDVEFRQTNILKSMRNFMEFTIYSETLIINDEAYVVKTGRYDAF